MCGRTKYKSFIKQIVKKILIVTKEYGNFKTGSGKYSHDLIVELSKFKDIKLSVICPLIEKSNDRLDGVNYFEFKKPNKSFGHASWLVYSSYLKREFTKAIKTEKYDIVHFTEARDALLIKKSDDLIFVGTVHDYLFAEANIDYKKYQNLYPFDWLVRIFYYNFGKLLERNTLKKFNKLISPSNYLNTILKNKYNLDKTKVDTINNGIALLNEKKLVKKKNQIFFVGNNYQHKGLFDLIKAADIVLKEYPVNFVIAGSDKKMQKKAELICRKNMIFKYFIFLGYQPNSVVKKYLSESKVFVYPSLVDNFPYTILESQTVGATTISTRTGGIPEIISNNVNGLLVKPHDYVNLAKNIIKLLCDSGLSEKLSTNSLKIIKKFSTKKMALKTRNCYSSLIS